MQYKGDEEMAAAHEAQQAAARAADVAEGAAAQMAIIRRAQEVEAARIRAEAAAQRERQEEQAELDTEAARVRALDAWVLAGGYEGTFKEMWPGIRREQLKQAALAGETAMDRLVAEKLAHPDSPYAAF